MKIQVSNLTKSYNDLKAIDSVSFDIESGETFGLLGPNGAGKTTTINVLIGLLAPDLGTVRIGNGADPSQAAVRQMIGNAPQALAIYEELSAEENLTFFGRLYGLSGEHLAQRVAFCLELAGLSDRAKEPVAGYSGGMKRRLNMVCAIVHDPPVMLFDEPTVGVDPQSRNLIFENIEHLRSEGRTIIYTTHYMEEAQRLCDRVAILDHGQLLALDTVPGLIARYGGVSVIEAELLVLPDATTTLPGVLTGHHLRIETDQPLQLLGQLSRDGVEFSRIHIDHADLESVFLNLTGRRLRD